MRGVLLIVACAYGLGQDTIGADIRVRGDYVEVEFWWNSASGYVPVAANFVLVWPQAEALGWEVIELTERGRWDLSQSPLYRPLYITQKREDSFQRVSLNVLPQDPGQGEAIPVQRARVGRYRVPIRQFGQTLQPRWGMESGEIVGLARRGEKGRFVYANLPAITLCPFVDGFRLERKNGNLSLRPPADYQAHTLVISWYHDGQLMAMGPSLAVPAGSSGLYYARIEHLCGSVAWSDTLALTTAGTSIASQGGWHVYPLPAGDFLYVLTPQRGPCSYVLTDLSGRRLLSGQWPVQAGPHILDLRGLSSGMYLLQLQEPEAAQTFLISHAW